MKRLILLGLPIGNFDDITIRVVEGLKVAKIILCEDTRVTYELLKHLLIDVSDKKLISFHDHTSEDKLNAIVNSIEYDDVYFCSDAGSPCISDPAYPLIKLCSSRGIEIESYPAVTSVMHALELSALPTIPFHFHGFIQRDNGNRKKLFETIKSSYGTHIFFEGVSRIVDTLNLIHTEFKSNDIVIARELTKKFQSVYRFKANEIPAILDSIILKGEFVILIYNEKESAYKSDLINLAQDVASSGGKPKQLAKLLAEILNLAVKDVYNSLTNKNEK